MILIYKIVNEFFFIGGLSKFARIAKSVTRNRSILMNFSAPNTKSIHIDPTKPSQLPNVCLHKYHTVLTAYFFLVVTQSKCRSIAGK